MTTPILAVRDLCVQHPDQGFRVGIPDLSVSAGEVVALAGPSGSGKSTLFRGIIGIGPELRSGSVEVDGLALPAPGSAGHGRWLREDVAFLMQDAVSALDPFVPVGEQLQQAASVDDAAVAEALQTLGVSIDRVPALLRQRPHELSGGEAQRCLFAVALLRRPKIVLCDEPTTGLDEDNRELIREHLDRLAARGAAVIVATHDTRLIAALGARVLRDQNGAFVPLDSPRIDWPTSEPRSVRPGAVILRAAGVAVRVGRRRRILEGVDLEVRRREVVAIVGASGVGKSALAMVLAGHCRPAAGRIDRPDRRTAVQLLFQDAHGSLTPGRSIASLTAETRAPGFDVPAVARQLELKPEHLARPVERLSGGERRRAALLRALSVQPEILICDEPLESLDYDSGWAVTRLLSAVNERRGVTLLVITHDLDWAKAFADRVVTVADGAVHDGLVASPRLAEAGGYDEAVEDEEES